MSYLNFWLLENYFQLNKRKDSVGSPELIHKRQNHGTRNVFAVVLYNYYFA